MRTLFFGVTAVFAVAGAPVMAHAAVYAKEGCQVTVPDGWVTSKTRIASPDKKQWASLLSAPTAADITKLEVSLGAKAAAGKPGVDLLVSTASFGGQTNVQFHAVTHTTPACLADVTAPAGAGEAAAKQIALTVRPGK